MCLVNIGWMASPDYNALLYASTAQLPKLYAPLLTRASTVFESRLKEKGHFQ